MEATTQPSKKRLLLALAAAILAVVGWTVVAKRYGSADPKPKPSPATVSELYGQALQAIEEKRIDDAIEIYTRLNELDPNAGWQMERGQVYFQKGEEGKALADFSELIGKDPLHKYAYSHRGNILQNQKEYLLAIDDYSTSIRINKANEWDSFNRASCWQGLYEYEKAINDYSISIQINPEQYAAHTYRGCCFFELKNYQSARNDFERALKIDSTDVEAHIGLANTHAKLKNYDLAVPSYEKALKILPGEFVLSSYAWFLATCPDEKYRNGTKALDSSLQAIAKLKTIEAKYHSTLAAALAETGDFERAVIEELKAMDLLLAEKHKDVEELKRAEKRLALYQNKKPYRDED
ncbi:MAG: tetratricopeptide repeat protein [Fimbriiglobus sp.]